MPSLPSKAKSWRITALVQIAGAVAIFALLLQFEVSIWGSNQPIWIMLVAPILIRNYFVSSGAGLLAIAVFAYCPTLSIWQIDLQFFPDNFNLSTPVWIFVCIALLAVTLGGAMYRGYGAGALQVERNKRHEELLNFIVKSAHLGILDYDLDSETICINEPLREIAGLVSNRLEPVEWMALFHPEERSGILIQGRKFFAPTGGDQRPLIRRLIRPDGSVRWVSINGKTFCSGKNGDRRITRQLLTIQEITIGVERDCAFSEAQRMEEIGRSTAGIAHNFNNVLAVILVHAELARNSTDGVRTSASLQAMISAARIASRMSERLVAFSKGTKLNPVMFDATRVVASVCKMLSGTLDPKFAISTDLSTSPTIILGDVGEFESCIINLILNARDAMSEGGIISVSSTIPLEPGGQKWIEISIHDTGCGMDEQTLARAGEPFFTTKPGGSGTGLGLSTSQNFATLSGGDLKLSSEVNVGTTARLLLPLVRVNSPVDDCDDVGYARSLHKNAGV